ncbi:hypothetical protein [Microcoleus sp. T3_A4]|uniref:hypothetical protein n=1 Tax=Microcoleus sp. T3_A4 TaxID=2818968 RepID=UPI002FD3BD5C
MVYSSREGTTAWFTAVVRKRRAWFTAVVRKRRAWFTAADRLPTINARYSSPPD